MRVATYKTREQWVSYLILGFLALITILPISTLLMNSIKPTEEFGTNALGFPNEVRFENYRDAWIAGNYSQIFGNTLKLVLGSLVLCLSVSGLAAFSLARLNPKGATLVSIYLLIGISIPAQMFILPLFLMWRNFGLINTHLGLIIIYSALNAPFATFLIRSYMIQLPEALFDAAKIDGATTFQLFTRIALPLSWPVFLTASLIVGIAVWNEFLFAMTFLHEDQMKPLASILFAFQSRFSNNWALTSAASVMMAAPIIILFLIFQRRFIAGLTQGSIK